VQHLAHERFEALHAGGNLAYELQRLRLLRDILRQQRRVQLDAAERVADLVGHARGHLAQRSQPVAPLELAVLFGQLAAEGFDGLLELVVRLLQPVGHLAVRHDDPPQLFDPLGGGGAGGLCDGARVHRCTSIRLARGPYAAAA
jgi:hypothetical protein